MRVRVRSQTQRASLLETDAAPSRPRRRSRAPLCDLCDTPPSATWNPDVLAVMSERVHATVPRGDPEPLLAPTMLEPIHRLDHGATRWLWRTAGSAGNTGFVVPMRPRNRDLAILGGVGTAYAGFAFCAFSIATAFGITLSIVDAPTVASGTHAALSGMLSAEALPSLVAAVLLGMIGAALLTLGGVWAWRGTREYRLGIGMHGIRYDGAAISYDEILGVRADGGELVFELLDGSEMHTPSGSLEPLVARSLRDEIISRLPTDEDRAAGFVAYERARQALGLV